MQMNEKEYQDFKRTIVSEGKKIYDEIKNKYAKYLLDKEKISSLEQNNGQIIVDDYNEEDIKLFGGIDKVPPGHSGRRKKDNIIHIYPYSPQLSFIDNIDSLKRMIINDVIIHEIFHYYAQPDLYDNNDLEHGDDVWFGHRLTEGIVQTFTNFYIKEHNLESSYTTYIEEVLLVNNIITDLKEQNKTDEEIISILLNDNQIEIINKCKNGESIKREFIAKTKLHKSINAILRKTLTELNTNKSQQEIYHYYATCVDVTEMYNRLIKELPAHIHEIDEKFAEYNNNLNFKQNNKNNQKSNYHTQTYRSGCLDYSSEEEIIKNSKENGISLLGFCDRIPNPDLILPDESHRMLLSEVDDYISSINNMKKDNSDMTLLIGFEAEFDLMKEEFLGEMRDKVDYMILGQYSINRGLQTVSAINNPNYPIEYANMLSKAIESGIFDIISNPDYFMKFRDTIVSEEDKKIFDENVIIASQIICEKARNMGIPIELYLSSELDNRTLSDGYLAYPHPTFWKVAQEIEGLQVIREFNIQDLDSFENSEHIGRTLTEIEQMMDNRFLQSDYNPITARQNNLKLQEAYKMHQENALTFETHLINQIVNGNLENSEYNLDAEKMTVAVGTTLNRVMQNYVDEADKKDKSTVEAISLIADSNKLSSQNKKIQLERKKQVINETNQVLAKQQRVIENAKNNFINAMNMGCKSKQEYLNIIAQITQLNSTENEIQKKRIEDHITRFIQSKNGGKNIQAIQFIKENNKKHNSSSGFTDAIMLTLIVTFVIGVIVGIGFVLYRLKIGG